MLFSITAQALLRMDLISFLMSLSLNILRVVRYFRRWVWIRVVFYLISRNFFRSCTSLHHLVIRDTECLALASIFLYLTLVKYSLILFWILAIFFSFSY